jgi:hypothetical protein
MRSHDTDSRWTQPRVIVDSDLSRD